MELNSLEQKVWWGYLDESQRELLAESVLLLQREESGGDNFHDYAFIVFPAAKAYEGFLKKLFLALGLINQDQYEGRHFRIGKALNPSIEDRFKDGEWVYENLKSECSQTLPDILWETWKESRNLVFHWFPNHKNAITLPEARARVEMIISAIERAFKECRIKI